MRFAVLLTFSIACIVWMVITIGGSASTGTHIAGAFGVVWFLSCVIAAGWFWTAILRYVLHLIESGHVAVLTELIVHGRVGQWRRVDVRLRQARRDREVRAGQRALRDQPARARRGQRRAPQHGGRRPPPADSRDRIDRQSDHRDSARGHAIHGQGDLLLQPRERRRQSSRWRLAARVSSRSFSS